jgi:hypothetical protein
MTLLAGAVLTVVCAVLLTRALYQTVTARQDFMECQNNVGEIGEAFKKYTAEHHTLPPAYTTKAEGTLLQSWRVLLLPCFDFFVHQTIVSRFRLEEPWNSDRNLALQDTYAHLYHCPDDPSPKTQTSYVVVIGAGTAFPGKKSTALPNDEKGKANTILVVETVMSGIHWMEPRDMPFNDAIRGIDVLPEKGITSRHPFPWPGGGSDNLARVLFSDGSVRSLGSNMDPTVLRQLLEPNGPKPTFNRPGLWHSRRPVDVPGPCPSQKVQPGR